MLGLLLVLGLLRLVLAISEGRGEEAADAAIQMGEERPGFDRSSFVNTSSALTAQFHGATARDIQVGRVMLEVSRTAALYGLRLPVLCMAGALDHKFVALAEEMVVALPLGQLAVVSEAGHAIHLEQPDRFNELVLDFLTQPSVAGRMA